MKLFEIILIIYGFVLAEKSAEYFITLGDKFARKHLKKGKKNGD